MEVRYGYENKNKTSQIFSNAGCSTQPMNTQTAEKWYKESKVPKGRVFFIDVAHYDVHDKPEKTFLGLFVTKWKTVKTRVWQRIYERENVGYY